MQIADKMIQSDQVDILTGIIWSNLAMAVVPSAVAQDKFYLSPNAGPSALAGANCHPNYFNVAYQNDNFHEAMGEYANEDYKKIFIMAPNYPAGTDALTGFKRFYKGELAGEVYTQVGQTDYAAEIAQIRASGADSRLRLPAGRHGHRLHEAVCAVGRRHPGHRPGLLLRARTCCGAIGDAALGVKNSASLVAGPRQRGQQGVRRGLPGRSTTACPRSMPRRPRTRRTSSSRRPPRPSVKDADAFRAALKEADFDSPCAASSSSTPTTTRSRTSTCREVVKEGDVLTNKIVATAFDDHADAYAEQCTM